MKKVKIFVLASLLVFTFSSCNTNIKYAAYNPIQNRFVKFVNNESVVGDYDYQTGDTVFVNGEKVVIICHN